MKICSKCSQEKPYSEYNRDKSKPDGYYSSCKVCQYIKNKRWVENNPDKVNAIMKRYLSTDKARLSAIKHVKIYRKRYPEKRRAHVAIQDRVKRKVLIKPLSCEYCLRSVRLEAHHYKGYEKEHQLDVHWICRKCHNRAHRS